MKVKYEPEQAIRDMREAWDQAHMQAYIKRTVDAAPPLTPEGRDRLRALLYGGSL